MYHFWIDPQVFRKLPHLCLGIVVAKGIDNRAENPAVQELLQEQTAAFLHRYAAENLRELPHIKAYREAFAQLNINPNKFMCSIEALSKRVQKNGSLPRIHPIVDLGNALSLKYLLSLGAHDVNKMNGSFALRLSTEADSFLGMGEAAPEAMPSNELVYASDNTVKTRRWIWRQSEDGKITEHTSHVFFPIDGFEDINREQVLAARDELAEILRRTFGCKLFTGYVNRTENRFAWSFGEN